MIKPAQIRAACALIGWSQADLERASGVSSQAISNAYVGRHAMKPENIELIEKALCAAGIEFTATGVQLADNIHYYHEGAHWYLDLMSDAEMTLKGAENPEILIENVDDRQSSPAVNEKLRQMRRDGIRLRMTTFTGNTFLAAPSACYRFIPAPYFKNWIVMVFGPKLAISVAGESRCLVIRDANAATVMRNKFELVWNMLPALDVETTAKDLI